MNGPAESGTRCPLFDRDNAENVLSLVVLLLQLRHTVECEVQKAGPNIQRVRLPLSGINSSRECRQFGVLGFRQPLNGPKVGKNES